MCDTTMEKQKTETSYLRKIKKPLIEKKRRDRINSCLSELKVILLDNIKLSGGTQVSKLDKADILEMTVSHLRQIQHQQMSVAMATNASVVHQYHEGYVECAKETVRYMDSTRVYPSDMSARLQRHLLFTAVDTPHSDRNSRRHTAVRSPHDVTSRNNVVRSLHFDMDNTTHTTTENMGPKYPHVPVKMVLPVKREPIYDVTERENGAGSPDSIQLGGEASNMDATVSQSGLKVEDNCDSSIAEAGTSKDSVLAMPDRIPVNASPSQNIVWRPF